MPDNRVEWGILGVGLVVLGLLGALIGLSLGDDPATGVSAATPPVVTEAFASPTPRTPKVATATEATPTTRAPAAPKPVTTAGRQPARPRPSGARLRLSATRGDSWLEVRSGSSAGPVLFSGTLARGTTRTFQAARLWVRFGGASNLDARLNGRALALRFGTYDVLVTPNGLAPPT